MSKRELDDLFKSKLSGYETEVRPEAWDRLSAKMNRKKASSCGNIGVWELQQA